MSDKDIPKGKPVYMLCVNDLSCYGKAFAQYAILDMTDAVYWDAVKEWYTGNYYDEETKTFLVAHGWGVELFYSKEGAIAFAAAHKISGSQEEYSRNNTQPPKP